MPKLRNRFPTTATARVRAGTSAGRVQILRGLPARAIAREIVPREVSVSKLERATERFGIMAEFFEYLWRQKLWWMMPMFAIIFIFGLLLILGQTSALAPFIYTLF